MSAARRWGRGGAGGGLGDEGGDGAGVVGDGHVAAAGQRLVAGGGRELVEAAGLVRQEQQVPCPEGDSHRHTEGGCGLDVARRLAQRRPRPARRAPVRCWGAVVVTRRILAGRLR